MRGLLAALCSPLSCALSLVLYGRWEALCARAWAEDWRRWVAVMDALMGEGHCRESWEWWRGRFVPPPGSLNDGDTSGSRLPRPSYDDLVA